MSWAQKLGFGLLLAVASPLCSASIDNAVVERTAPNQLAVHWMSKSPVDVYVSTDPDFPVGAKKLVSSADEDGMFAMPADGQQRLYFELTSGDDATIVAERLLPLEKGSNFRDLGGYPAAGGKHVRWGKIFRSGATPVLTDKDVARVQAMGIRQLVDLRSNEERVLGPTRLDGIPYTAIGYSMAAIMPKASDGKISNGDAVYRRFPTLLAPQLRLIFDDLLNQRTPIAYNCSAGQDRTGFVSAMILSALGVPRDVILQDYHLSTKVRQPINEMPVIDTVAQANNPVAMYFAKFHNDPKANSPQPLMNSDGRAFLDAAFAEIDEKWGSIDGYLAQEIGLTRVEIASLRRQYLQ